METVPHICMDNNTVQSFCDCISESESVDVAARGFCERVKRGEAKNVTGDDLAELKKALKDMES